MKVKVGLVQQRCSAIIEQNIDKTINNIRRLAAQGANIICLQELFASLYFCDVEDYDNFNLAETIPGNTTAILSDLSKELGIVIVASLFEKRASGLYHNTAVVFDADGAMLGRYRKMHIPDDPGYYEKFYFTPGDLGYKVFKTRFGTIGVLICWDQWFVEASRLTALKGAEIIFYPTAIGWAKTQDQNSNTEQYNAWKTIQLSHAVANGVHTVSVNRTGEEGEMQFWGGSFVSNPFGTVLHQSPHLEEDNAIVEIDLSLTNHYRTHWPFLRDRRVDSYREITERFIDGE